MKPNHLPRAKELFAEAELEAERTVAILRIVIALMLGGVFVLTISRDLPYAEPFLIRQWVFAITTIVSYFILGLLSYFMTARGVYRSWMAWVVVTLDVLFVLISLWLALENTGLASDYMIILPSIWLVPALLAFGSLRFNPFLQVYLVLLLITGMIGLFIMYNGGVVVSREMLPSKIEVFFAPPPNIMRFTMIVLAGLVLIIAAKRARTLLLRAIAEVGRNFNLTRYLPKQISERLAESGIDELRQGKRLHVAVLFVDIRGFTSLSETMSPEEMSEFVSEFRVHVATAVDACGGIIDKFIGDAAMVVFGLVENPDNHSAAALRCGQFILLEMENWSKRRALNGLGAVNVGVGVHWGEVFAGAIGDEARLEYTILGDSVNVAARLEELTKHTGYPILASQDAIKAAGAALEQGDWQQLENDTLLRGKSSTTTIFGLPSHNLPLQ